MPGRNDRKGGDAATAKYIGNAVRRRRNELRKTQRAVADGAQMSRAELQKIEGGRLKRGPTVGPLVRIADELDCYAGDFLPPGHRGTARDPDDDADENEEESFRLRFFDFLRSERSDADFLLSDRSIANGSKPIVLASLINSPIVKRWSPFSTRMIHVCDFLAGNNLAICVCVLPVRRRSCLMSAPSFRYKSAPRFMSKIKLPQNSHLAHTREPTPAQ